MGTPTPPRPSWADRLRHLAHLALSTLAEPSSYLLLAAWAMTAAAKFLRLLRLETAGALRWTGWSVALDAAVYLSLAALLTLAEHRLPRLRPAAIALAAAVAALAAGNAAYLLVAGDQVGPAALAALWDRWGDVLSIAEHALPLGLVLGSLAAVAGLVAAFFALRRLRRAPAAPGTHRAALSAAVAAAVGLGVALTPRPRHPDIRRLGHNVLVALARGVLAGPTRGSFAGYQPAPQAPQAAPATGQRHPNIILLLLESTRYDHTDLAGAGALASTPRLASLADGGFQVPVMRAVVPHTTKALFTMLCGQLPLLQRELWELSGDVQADCLPAMLRRAGYRTAFFQSAQGLFEQRARLARKLGYDHFQPWEDIRGHRLGYLASDDMSLMPPLRRWLDSTDATGKPFFVTLLTSSTHHPYKLPPRIEQRAEELGLPTRTDAERYARLVEGEDELLGALLDMVDYRSLRDNTVVIAIGDHGEGFGAHSVKQHDQNLYEEGVRVPFVVAGTGIEPRVARGNGSALDFLPTILGLLDLPDLPSGDDLPGLDLSRQDVPADRPSWMSCWFASRCRGFVVGRHKVIEEPENDDIFAFNLETDPKETRPLPLTDELKQVHARMLKIFEEHRITGREIVHPELKDTYGLWWCPQDDDKCKHPRARHPDFRYRLDPDEPAQRRPPPKTAPPPRAP